MQQQPSTPTGFQNRDSFHSRMNSNMSIDRSTRRSLSPFRSNKISLIDAMDLQSLDRKSDLYQNVLGDQRRSSNNYKRSSNVSRGEFFSRVSRESQAAEKIENQGVMQQGMRHSRQSSTIKTLHQCNCTQQQCNQQHCSCFLYPNELCIIGLCCNNCIKSKNQFLTKQHQIQQSLTMNGCLCKNIKCLKLYCRCYREGKKCSPSVCKCDGCENDCDGLLDRKKRRVEFHNMRDNGNGLLHVSHSNRQNYILSASSKQQKSSQPIDPTTYTFINCSCKKSHCLKKYCSCFLNNKSCSQSCVCEQCHNTYDQNDLQDQRNRKARYARHDQDDGLELGGGNEIDQFLEKDEFSYEKEEMNENMEFEPVRFDDQMIGK